MNKYKIMILVVLMTTLIAGFATAQDQDIKVSILTNLNYQFDLTGFEQLSSEFTGAYGDITQARNSLDLLSKFNLGVAFQMLFALTDGIALGFEIGADIPIASLIAATTIQPLGDSFDNSDNFALPGLVLLPRAVFEIGGFDDLLSIDILAGLRFGFSSLSQSITNTVAAAGANFAFTFGVDLEARLNIQFSRHFALYAGINYILPIDVVVTDVGAGAFPSTRPDNLPEYVGEIAPSIGVRFSF